MTPQEIKLWVHLRELRALGLLVRRQSPIATHIVDFECRKAHLVIEVDGGQHALEVNATRDRLRDKDLGRAGYRVLRFWNHEIDREMDAVLATIVRAVSPHPAPRFARRHPPLKGRDE